MLIIKVVMIAEKRMFDWFRIVFFIFIVANYKAYTTRINTAAE